MLLGTKGTKMTFTETQNTQNDPYSFTMAKGWGIWGRVGVEVSILWNAGGGQERSSVDDMMRKWHDGKLLEDPFLTTGYVETICVFIKPAYLICMRHLYMNIYYGELKVINTMTDLRCI